MKSSRSFNKIQILIPKMMEIWLILSSNSTMMKRYFSLSQNKLESKKEERKQLLNIESVIFRETPFADYNIAYTMNKKFNRFICN